MQTIYHYLKQSIANTRLNVDRLSKNKGAEGRMLPFVQFIYPIALHFQLFERLESRGVSANTGDEKLDKFMRDAVIALRTHLIELQKVSSLADDFYSKYLQALRRRMSHEVLVGVSGDSDDDLTDPNSTDEVEQLFIEHKLNI
ncbi:unnamed protein product [Heligmosomoides polygyrus]|uniref:MEIS N-terminal domain-containing protein n=1 Tax=Heligmosomoides polygyrus TaxID=6339 RepID=A0A3P7U4G7_HELPZ|nr:unnamed protein product [Heligmosomoides polygyrus]